MRKHLMQLMGVATLVVIASQTFVSGLLLTAGFDNSGGSFNDPLVPLDTGYLEFFENMAWLALASFVVVAATGFLLGRYWYVLNLGIIGLLVVVFFTPLLSPQQLDPAFNIVIGTMVAGVLGPAFDDLVRKRIKFLRALGEPERLTREDVEVHDGARAALGRR